LIFEFQIRKLAAKLRQLFADGVVLGLVLAELGRKGCVLVVAGRERLQLNDEPISI
jgi:hypothetical protein